MTHLILYDGVCGLCDFFVRFLIRMDRHDRLRFAALEGPIGAAVLKRHGREAAPLSTLLVIPDQESADPRLLDRSDAALFAIASTGGVYRAAAVFRIVPRPLRDAVYGLVARWRYRVFGRFESCPVPRAEIRAKFVDFATRPGPP